MLHYEIAIAIIGIMVTLMGIIIAFHIGALHMSLTDDKFKLEMDEFFTEFRKVKKTGNDMKKKKAVEVLKSVSKEFDKDLVQIKGMFWKSGIVFMIGLVVIFFSIIQTFWWKIDPKTLAIHQQDFAIFFVLLMISFLWTGYYIVEEYHSGFMTFSKINKKVLELLIELENE